MAIAEVSRRGPGELCWHGLEPLRDPLRKFLAQRCRDESEADDIIQETFLRAARYRGGLAHPGRLRSWVMRIASNVFRDTAARSCRGPLVVDDEALERVEGREVAPGEDPREEWLEVAGEWMDRDVLVRLLRTVMATLKADDRDVLSEYYRGGESCATTAAVCGIPRGLVKVRLFRARRRLEQLLERRVVVDRTQRLLDA